MTEIFAENPEEREELSSQQKAQKSPSKSSQNENPQSAFRQDIVSDAEFESHFKKLKQDKPSLENTLEETETIISSPENTQQETQKTVQELISTSQEALVPQEEDVEETPIQESHDLTEDTSEKPFLFFSEIDPNQLETLGQGRQKKVSRYIHTDGKSYLIYEALSGEEHSLKKEFDMLEKLTDSPYFLNPGRFDEENTRFICEDPAMFPLTEVLDEIPFNQRLHLSQQCIKALSELHELGFLHADLFPKQLYVSQKNNEYQLFVTDLASVLKTTELHTDTQIQNSLMAHRSLMMQTNAQQAQIDAFFVSGDTVTLGHYNQQSEIQVLAKICTWIITAQVPTSGIKDALEDCVFDYPKLKLETRFIQSLLQADHRKPEKRFESTKQWLDILFRKDFILFQEIESIQDTLAHLKVSLDKKDIENTKHLADFALEMLQHPQEEVRAACFEALINIFKGTSLVTRLSYLHLHSKNTSTMYQKNFDKIKVYLQILPSGFLDHMKSAFEAGIDGKKFHLWENAFLDILQSDYFTENLALLPLSGYAIDAESKRTVIDKCFNLLKTSLKNPNHFETAFNILCYNRAFVQESWLDVKEPVIRQLCDPKKENLLKSRLEAFKFLISNVNRKPKNLDDYVDIIMGFVKAKHQDGELVLEERDKQTILEFFLEDVLQIYKFIFNPLVGDKLISSTQKNRYRQELLSIFQFCEKYFSEEELEPYYHRVLSPFVGTSCFIQERFRAIMQFELTDLLKRTLIKDFHLVMRDHKTSKAIIDSFWVLWSYYKEFQQYDRQFEVFITNFDQLYNYFNADKNLIDIKQLNLLSKYLLSGFPYSWISSVRISRFHMVEDKRSLKPQSLWRPQFKNLLNTKTVYDIRGTDLEKFYLLVLNKYLPLQNQDEQGKLSTALDALRNHPNELNILFREIFTIFKFLKPLTSNEQGKFEQQARQAIDLFSPLLHEYSFEKDKVFHELFEKHLGKKYRKKGLPDKQKKLLSDH